MKLCLSSKQWKILTEVSICYIGTPLANHCIHLLGRSHLTQKIRFINLYSIILSELISQNPPYETSTHICILNIGRDIWTLVVWEILRGANQLSYKTLGLLFQYVIFFLFLLTLFCSSSTFFFSLFQELESTHSFSLLHWSLSSKH